MNRKILALAAGAALCLSLAACAQTGQTSPAGANSAGASVSAPASQTAEPAAPDLSGEWKQVDGNSEDTYQTATIAGDTIEIYWVMESEGTQALYWAGSFTAPETADEPYTWESVNDTEKTASALLASGDKTKTFTYQDGQILYDVSAFGVTETVKLEKP